MIKLWPIVSSGLQQITRSARKQTKILLPDCLDFKFPQGSTNVFSDRLQYVRGTIKFHTQGNVVIWIPQMLCFFLAPGTPQIYSVSTKCATRCSTKCRPKTPTDVHEGPDMDVFNSQRPHKICNVTTRRTTRLEMFVFTENRTNSQRLSANSQDQDVVCY